jgi:hypothetical protein
VEAISAARAAALTARGNAAPGADGGLIPAGIDATIVTKLSDKEQAAPSQR